MLSDQQWIETDSLRLIIFTCPYQCTQCDLRWGKMIYNYASSNTTPDSHSKCHTHAIHMAWIAINWCERWTKRFIHYTLCNVWYDLRELRKKNTYRTIEHEHSFVGNFYLICSLYLLVVFFFFLCFYVTPI